MHPRLLGRCYDNVYTRAGHRRLSARGKPPTEDNTRDVYDREYAEVVSRIKDARELDHLSAREFPIPCSLKNPEEFAKRRNLPPPAPGRVNQPGTTKWTGPLAWWMYPGLRGFRVLRKTLLIRDPRYNQYPYQEGDEVDEEEDMDVEGPRVCSDARPRRPGAEYESGDRDSTPGFTPRSTHTDTDTATEFDTLRVGTPHPEHRHVTLPSVELRILQPTRWQPSVKVWDKLLARLSLLRCLGGSRIP